MRKRGRREVRGEGERERERGRRRGTSQSCVGVQRHGRRGSTTTGKMEDDHVCARCLCGGRGAARGRGPGRRRLPGWIQASNASSLLPWTSPHPATTSIQLMAEDDAQVPGAAGGEVKMARAAGEIPPLCTAASSRPGGARLPALRRRDGRWRSASYKIIQYHRRSVQVICV